MPQYSKLGSNTERLQGLAGKGVLMERCLHSTFLVSSSQSRSQSSGWQSFTFFPMAQFSEGLLISLLQCSLISGNIQRNVLKEDHIERWSWLEKRTFENGPSILVSHSEAGVCTFSLCLDQWFSKCGVSTHLGGHILYDLHIRHLFYDL